MHGLITLPLFQNFIWSTLVYEKWFSTSPTSKGSYWQSKLQFPPFLKYWEIVWNHSPSLSPRVYLIHEREEISPFQRNISSKQFPFQSIKAAMTLWGRGATIQLCNHSALVLICAKECNLGSPGGCRSIVFNHLYSQYRYSKFLLSDAYG